MNKIKLKIIPSIDSSEILYFISQNSKHNWNGANDVFTDELNHITWNLPHEIETEVEFRIFKVMVDNLIQDGWIKKFTETQELTENYYILFTD